VVATDVSRAGRRALKAEPSGETEASVLQRFGDFIDAQRKAMNIDAQLHALPVECTQRMRPLLPICFNIA